ncbi:hypothetical protein SSX86_029138 [Deinandra increscens subsp. villosa]|uniref:Uncharacterized protein n=1 Tax=Deinandra increscens subsp. villosa TaxID=3103831 RepID=A0AAP0CFT7_9ASTR
MSHKKTNSMVHIPFSWEKIPGVPKLMTSPLVPPVRVLAPEVRRKTAIPLPPGFFGQPVRSVSKRTVLREEDPFLVAMKECTKDCDKCKGKGEVKKRFEMSIRISKIKSSLFSCKHSFDVEVGNLSLPPFRIG